MKKILILLLLVYSVLFAEYTAPMQMKGATAVDSKQAYALYEEGKLFLDVRPYNMVKQQGKIKGAANIYVDHLNEKELSKLMGKNTPVIVYCNGVGCSLTPEAIVMMVNWGYTKVYYYRDGYPAWKYYGLPLQ